MRRAAKVDDNQDQIVKALRACGCSVQSLASVGKGCPDLLVGRLGRNYALEVKDGAKAPSRRKLTPLEEKFHVEWRGQVTVVTSVAEALEAVGIPPQVRLAKLAG